MKTAITKVFLSLVTSLNFLKIKIYKITFFIVNWAYIKNSGDTK